LFPLPPRMTAAAVFSLPETSYRRPPVWLLCRSPPARGLVREGEIRDYAAVARLGCVTRARMTQIMMLLNLAPDIQEQILFLPPIRGLNERTLRPISNQIDWDESRPVSRL
jgi:hypothetical protein